MKITNLMLILCLLILFGCSSKDSKNISRSNLKGEYIYRHQDDKFSNLEWPQVVERSPYPWEEGKHRNFPKITKEFFRCRGVILNPMRVETKGKEVVNYFDCGGSTRHSLPIRDQKEFIYPILIDLLNYLQDKTERRVVITCGHCCPDHNLYLDSSVKHQASKHLIGAEVDFYIQGLENQPNKVVNMIQGYFKENRKYKGLKNFEEFKRYEKEDTNVCTMPWYNEEIFIKLYTKNEGRDFDNRHPYSYVSIQVRYDWDTKEKVIYSWDQAFHNFHRW